MSRPRRASLRSAAPGPPLPGAGLSSRQLRGLTPVMGWGGQAQGHPPPPRLPGRQASAEEERDPSPGAQALPSLAVPLAFSKASHLLPAPRGPGLQGLRREETGPNHG